MNTMNYISQKVIFILILSVIVVMSVLGFLYFLSEKKRSVKSVRTAASQTLERISNSLTYSLWNVDKAETEKTILLEMANQDILAIIVNDNNGEFYMGKIKKSQWETCDYTPDKESERELKQSFLVLDRRIEMEDEIAGFVKIFVTEHFLNQSLNNLIIRTILQIFALSVIIILVVFFSLKNIILTPLIELKETVERFRQRDFSARASVCSNDEIGALATTFNTMALQINESFEEIQKLNEKLEQRVRDRTAELAGANDKILSLNEELEEALIRSEKMADLGQIIAGVAHEIKTPLGAIRASIDNISDSLHETLHQLPKMFQLLPQDLQKDFFFLIERSSQRKTDLTAKQERKLKRALKGVLEEQGFDNADEIADTLTDMGIYDDTGPFLPIFQHPESLMILEAAYNLSGLQRNSGNIATAVNRATKIVLALKSYAHYDHTGEPVASDLVESIETVLTLYHNQLKHGIEVIRRYEEVPPVLCYPDELNQVWTNLVHNAIQAMEDTGTLEVDVCQKENRAVVMFTDSGKGIPDEIRERIFESFFTTKTRGEGSGLGLSIVQKIIEKHQGTIKVDSQPGKTTFSVSLPIKFER